MKSKIQTKMLSIILSAVTIISLLTAPVSAASSGDCGYYTGNVTYTLDNEGLLTISSEESTSAITMTEGDDACTFTVTANVNEAAYAYAALYNVYGGLISVKSTPIESDVTDIEIEKSPYNAYANVFVWDSDMRSLA